MCNDVLKMEVDELADGGLSIFVKAHPGGKSNRIRGVHDGALKVEVTAAPERGKANKAILKLLSRVLRVKTQDLSVECGASASRKRIGIRGIDMPELVSRLSDCLNKGQV